MECIFSGLDREAVVEKIHAHLEEVASKMRKGELPLEKFIITKGLNKHPNDYPDGKSMAHVQVAKQMLKNNQNVNKGDHIPYVVCKKTEEELEVERAKNNGVLPKQVASGGERDQVNRRTGERAKRGRTIIARRFAPRGSLSEREY